MISLLSLTDKSDKRFQNLVLATVVIIYLLILAGGIVRGTGSGMGCPDWPKCFGRWIPPTQLEQLPINYQEIYGAKLKGEVLFNPVKTWIEYINRLLGVLSGLFVFATLISSIPFWKKDKAIVYGSFLTFILIGINGWLGSKVVATELAHYTVTIHLMLAILVVFALLFVLVRSRADKISTDSNQIIRRYRWLFIAIILIMIGQITLGTQVRDALNEVVKKLGYSQRDSWISELDWRFYVHRSFSSFVLGIHVYLIILLRKIEGKKAIRNLTNTLLALVIFEIGTGVIMAGFGVPAYAQPIHLLIAILIVGIQFTLLLLVNPQISLPNKSTQLNRLLEA